MKIICITPIDNIKGVKERLHKLCNSFVYMPECAKEELILTLMTSNEDTVIFTNPNRQQFMLDIDILSTSCKHIVTASTGTNHIDKKYCRDNGIEITCIAKERETLDTITSTAEHAFTLMMCGLRNIVPSNKSVEIGKWDCEPFIGRQLNKLKVGIVGYGRLGTMMAKYCDAFGAEVLVCDPYVKQDKFKQVALWEIFTECDVISLHVHVDDRTRYMVNTDMIACREGKPLLIVNTSRGEIVCEEDLIEWLNDGNIKYATDVLIDEFSDEWIKSPLINNPNVIITPHIGGMTHDAREIAYNRVIDLFEMKLNQQ